MKQKSVLGKINRIGKSLEKPRKKKKKNHQNQMKGHDPTDPKMIQL